MILTQLPDLPPRPETQRNAAFRRQFYSLWGKENWIVCGQSRHAEYARFRQTLSIKMISNGAEHYYVDRRRLTVTDETYLVLNENREYSSVLDAPAEAFSFCVFFKPGFANEIAASSRMNVAQALDAGTEPKLAPVEFSEHLRRHERSISILLRYLCHHVRSGVTDMNWYDEQFIFLLERLIRNEKELAKQPESVPCARGAKREELMRRLRWATDFIHSNLHRELSLTEIARTAHLSNYHFLRMFRQVFQMTPMEYLRAQRTQRAIALLRSTSLEVQEIAEQVGFSRLSLWRNVRQVIGEGPLRMRQRATQSGRQPESSDCIA